MCFLKGEKMRIDRIKLISHLMKRNLTQKKIAEMAGISRNTVSSIKCGRSCSEEVGNAIARALQVDIKELLENENEQTQ